MSMFILVCMLLTPDWICCGFAPEKGFVKKEIVPVEDPFLAEQVSHVLRKIESESPKQNALKLVKILNATKQKASGTSTKISMSLAYTDCKKSLSLDNRINCNIVKDMGTSICEVGIREKTINNKLQIRYYCIDKNAYESFSDSELVKKKEKTRNMNDPEIRNIVKEALKNLEMKSNRKEKLKVVDIKSVSTELAAGLLTKVTFNVGYTNCQTDKTVDENMCQLLQNVPLRECEAEVWDRPQLQNGRQINVKCDNNRDKELHIQNNTIEVLRKKRSPKWPSAEANEQIVGGEVQQDPNESKYQKLTKDLIFTHLRIKETEIKNITVDKVTTQVVDGWITRIRFRVFLVKGQTVQCNSKIYEQPLKNVKHVSYSCMTLNDNKKLSLSLSATPRPNQSRDPNDPKYLELATASLKTWYTTNDPKPFKKEDIKVIRVTSAQSNVSDKINNFLNFTVITGDNDNFDCTSVIMETPGKPDYTREFPNIECIKTKNHLQSAPGGEMYANPGDPKYKQLAKKSFEMYQRSHIGLRLKDLTVTRVTTQVVSGVVTRIDFNVISFESVSLSCHSEILEKPWLQTEEITVECQEQNKNRYKKLTMSFEGNKYDPDDPKYKKLAKESARKYVDRPGNRHDVIKDITMKSVTSVMTRIRQEEFLYVSFDITTNTGVYNCSSVYETQDAMKHITVDCIRYDESLDGGSVWDDPSDDKFKVLAEKSLKKYLDNSNDHMGSRDILVTFVRKRLATGSVYRINFIVRPVNRHEFECNSSVWNWDKAIIESVNCNIHKKLNVANNQLLGGEVLENPDDPKYKQLAKKSFEKYQPGHTITLKDLEVTRVTTQVVAGVITRIDFNVNPNKGSPMSCHSEIWEDTLLKKEEITVKCSVQKKLSMSNGKGSIVGGEVLENPDDPKYKELAKKSFEKYQPDHTITLKDVEVTRVTTQVVAGVITRIDFNVNPNKGSPMSCHSKIWEDTLPKKEKVTVKCSVLKKLSMSNGKGSIVGGEVLENPDDPKYKELAKKSFEKYQPDHTITLKDVEVTRVTTQVVAGVITRIDFNVNPNKGSPMSCHSKIWEDTLPKKEKVTVKCSVLKKLSMSNGKGSIVGGEVLENPDDPKYKQLAKKSFEKYQPGHTITLKDLEVTRVTTQVVAGVITRIDFNVNPNKGSPMSCHSKIWEDTLPKKEKVTVKCSVLKKLSMSNGKGSIVGGEVLENPDDPKYKQLAKKSFQKYQPGHTITLKDLEVTRVTTQVVAGVITRIDFNVNPNKGSPMSCHSKIWEDTLPKKEKVTVKCSVLKKLSMSNGKGSIVGGEVLENPDDPKYKELAKKSFEKYQPGHTITLKDVEVTRVTTQVVAGVITRIDFNVNPNKGSPMSCHSKIWEDTLPKKEKVTVKCSVLKKLSMSNGKGSIVGGEVLENPDDPKYKQLAKKSFEKYQPGHTITLKDLEVTRVTTQVVAGVITRIDFNVNPNKGSPMSCHSKIWEDTLPKKEKVTVKCSVLKKLSMSNGKGSIVGGEVLENPDDPKYKQLAKKSFQKYQPGHTITLKDLEVTRVTTQVVAGVITRIDFNVNPNKGSPMSCHSEIWEDTLLKKEEITVKCSVQKKLSMSNGKGSIVGGEVLENPDDPKYKQLAKKSFEKYQPGHTITLKDLEVTRVTTQVVAGVITRIDFNVNPNKGSPMSCHSKIWEDTLPKKEKVTVKCSVLKKLSMSNGKGSIVGGEVLENPEDPKYKQLAKKSFEKYQPGHTIKLKDLEVTRVTTQVVAGVITRIDFNVNPNKGSPLSCHSEIWEDTLLRKEKITVKCQAQKKLSMSHGKGPIWGGQEQQNPDDPEYKELAEESFERYQSSHGQRLQVKDIKVIKVTTQVVAGTMIRINFRVIRIKGRPLLCNSTIWEHSNNKKDVKDFTVKCVSSQEP